MWDSVAFSINKLLDALWHPSAQTLHVEVIINVLSYALKPGCELVLHSRRGMFLFSNQEGSCNSSPRAPRFPRGRLRPQFECQEKPES